MANAALTKSEQNALTVSYDVLGSHVELDLNFVKNYLVRGSANYVSDQEIIFFMNTCKQQGLNPLVQGEVYLIKYSKDDAAQIQVGKGAYMRRAFEHPSYIQKKDGITVQRGNEIVQKEGCCLYPGENLVGGWCRVYYERGGKEQSAYKEVALSEYNKGKANWNTKPATMINKVAISQCVRDAFPKEYEGLYSEEELTASGVIPSATDEPLEDPPITQSQRKQLFGKAQILFGKENMNEVIVHILGEMGLEATEGMPTSAFEKAMLRLDELKAEREQENVIDVDPVPLSEDEDKYAGTPFEGFE